jgi:hypothetical protein
MLEMSLETREETLKKKHFWSLSGRCLKANRNVQENASIILENQRDHFPASCQMYSLAVLDKNPRDKSCQPIGNK